MPTARYYQGGQGPFRAVVPRKKKKKKQDTTLAFTLRLRKL